MIDNFYLHQMMKKSDRKNYLGNKRGVFTITFPKYSSNRHLKFTFKPGNTYILKGETLENVDLSFPNSNVVIEGLQFRNCYIESNNGVVNYYCDRKENSITKTKANKVIVTDYENYNFTEIPITANDLTLNNVKIINENYNYSSNIYFRVLGKIELNNSTIMCNVPPINSTNPNQSFIFDCNKLLMKDSVLSTICNKSIKNNDNVNIFDGNYFSILISANDIMLHNSSIESGFNINVSSTTVTLANSLIASIRNSETNIKSLNLFENSDIIAIKPIFWEPYIQEINVSNNDNSIIYCCEQSLMGQIYLENTETEKKNLR